MARRQEWQGLGDAYQPYRFNHTADFGVPISQRNQFTGVSVPEFSKIATLHYARRNQTVSDRYQAAGTDYQDTMMITIRHNRDLSSRKVLFVKLDGKLYKVINYSINNETFNSVDMLTLKHVEKVG